LKRFVKGSLNIRRYHLSNLGKRLIFPYEMREGKSTLVSVKEYQERFPMTWAYLNANKDRLSARGKGRLGKANWFGYVYRKNHTRLGSPKLLVPSIATGSCFAADLQGEFYFVGSGGGGGGGYGISLFPDASISYYYLLGLLNSKVLSYFLKLVSTPFRGGYIALNRQYIEQLPVRTINFTDPADVARHDKMVALVERMLALHEKLAAASIPADKELYQRQTWRERSAELTPRARRTLEATDRQIDALVYELYALTDEEIKIVEEATR
jgi:hypothetical protein